MFPRFKSILYLRIARNYFRTFLSLFWLSKTHGISRSLNLQGFFVFRIVQFSRYQFVIFSIRCVQQLFYYITSLTVCQEVFWTFLKFFELPIRGIDRCSKQLIYHITFFSVCQVLFQNFFSLLSVWVVLPALLATYLFYHTCPRLSTRNYQQCIWTYKSNNYAQRCVLY